MRFLRALGGVLLLPDRRDMKRRETKRLDLLRYVTGKPCKQGHLAERSTLSARCLECDRVKSASVLVRERKYREYWADPAAARLKATKWRQAHPEYCRAKKRMRRASKRKSLIDELFKLQRGRCAYCRSDLAAVERHVDHIQPLARGGADARHNLQLTCAPCNMLKGAKDPIAFARERSLLL